MENSIASEIERPETAVIIDMQSFLSQERYREDRGTVKSALATIKESSGRIKGSIISIRNILLEAEGKEESEEVENVCHNISHRIWMWLLDEPEGSLTDIADDQTGPAKEKIIKYLEEITECCEGIHGAMADVRNIFFNPNKTVRIAGAHKVFPNIAYYIWKSIFSDSDEKPLAALKEKMRTPNEGIVRTLRDLGLD